MRSIAACKARVLALAVLTLLTSFAYASVADQPPAVARDPVFELR